MKTKDEVVIEATNALAAAITQGRVHLPLTSAQVAALGPRLVESPEPITEDSDGGENERLTLR